MRLAGGRDRGGLRTASWIAVGGLLLATAGYVVWDRDFRRASPSNPAMTCPIVVRAGHRLPLTALRVHRVALIGDSIMAQASCAIADSLANVGITTSRHAVPATGLLNGTVDWFAATRQILHTEHPNIVVAIFVGNYPLPPIRDATGTPILDDSPAFFRAWQRRAEVLSAEVRAAGAQMYWVSPPPIALSPLRHAQRLFDGYRTIPHDHVLSSGGVLAGMNGQPVMAKITCGRTRLVRSTFDFVHLSNDGARIYGEQIAHDLTARLGLLVAPRPC